MPELVIFHRGQPILRENLQSTLTLGSNEDCDIGLLDSGASCHARLEITANQIAILPQEGPVVVNGEKISESHPLRDGDLFELGPYRCQIFDSLPADFFKQEKTRTAHLGPETESASLPLLQILTPTRKKFRRMKIHLGRSSAADYTLDNDYVSSEHAEIFIHQGKYIIRDLHSRNGTFVNDVRITEKALPSSGVIRLGKADLTYEIQQPAGATSENFPGYLLPGLKSGTERRLIGSSVTFSALMERLKKIAPSDDAVLLLGETGVGKDLFAHFLHHHHPKRKGYPFVVVNCAAIPQTLAESQLFGHMRGAFTGAMTDHKGFFEEANRGTLFLDEVGDLPLETQARLLRVIEDGLIRPLGSSREIPVDVRLIFATNRNLNDARSDGKFREDLFQRFQWMIKIPPLRERREDIPDIVRYFLKEHATSDLDILPEAMSFLQSLPWTGNIRELNRVVRRAITNAVSRDSDQIELEDFEIYDQQPETGQKLAESRRDKRKSLQDILQKASGNISQAAKMLGVSRVTIHKWIQEDQINPDLFRIKE